MRTFVQRIRFHFTRNKERKILSKFVRSIQERAWDENLIKSVIYSSQRTGVVTEIYSLSSDQPRWIRNSKSFDPEYIYVLAEACVSVGLGAVWLQDGKIIGESYGSISRLLANKRFQLDYFSSYQERRYEVIAFPHTGGFFHFMFEVLPAAIACLEDFPHFKLLIPANAPKYIAMFAGLISDSDAIIEKGALLVKKIAVAGKTPYSGFVQKAEIKRIQAFFLRKFPAENAELKIYISRGKDQRRRMENESELEIKLRSLGFHSHYLQDLTVSDQIKLFRKAKAVIAPHGAGLSNLIWCNKGTKVIEIFPFKPRNDCYSRLSINLELDYQFYLCKESKRSSGIIPINDVLNAAAFL